MECCISERLKTLHIMVALLKLAPDMRAESKETLLINVLQKTAFCAFAFVADIFMIFALLKSASERSAFMNSQFRMSELRR